MWVVNTQAYLIPCNRSVVLDRKGHVEDLLVEAEGADIRWMYSWEYEGKYERVIQRGSSTSGWCIVSDRARDFQVGVVKGRV